MKFLCYAVVRGECCDYGWGTRGNAQLFELEADSLDAAREKILANEEIEFTLHGSERPLKSLRIFQVADTHEVDVSALLRERREQEARWAKEKQEAKEREELQRLQAKYGK